MSNLLEMWGQLPHTDVYAAMLIADLLTLLPFTTDGSPIIEEAQDYLAAARREHPEFCARFGNEAVPHQE